MSWKETILNSTPAFRAFEEYARERIAVHTETCTSTASSDIAIRQAQAVIAELNQLIDLPKTLATEAKARANVSTRKEY